ncbi:MILDEW RESISTANCE LOCUS O 14 [Hibiscus trionum]|uniref:MLO-like protein n=1 Tax=Hibiscus trionum TaxID=183268 RepID=A0A9W7MQ10_HIBTR|nr:MILDEW RESISTANCE LOCUS O 14 [Hibiscus trionum]
MVESVEDDEEMRSVASTPTWSTATVLTVFVTVSLIVERSIHRLTNWLKKSERKHLLKALDKMKEELMLLGFMSLILVATSTGISDICIPSRFYTTTFIPCSRPELDEGDEIDSSKERYLVVASDFHSSPRILRDMNTITCKEGREPFVSYEGLEQLHRFIFVMAITHIAYSCLTMLLAIVKVHRWRAWEEEAHMDQHGFITAQARESLMRRQTAFVLHHRANPLTKSRVVIWVVCYFRQFGWSVVRADYLTLRKGFIINHKLSPNYDFHNYMVRSMEEEFQMIVGISAPLWGFVVVFMLCNVEGSNLYFWIAIIPITLVLLVGAKLEHVMATLTLESAGITGYCTGTRLRPRDELFWFKKPEWLLSLIHFILFQNSFELASFFWYWWQFGYNSCFLRNHTLVFLRIIFGVSGQFMCSYITLPLYALVTQMGTHFKAALIPQGVRETIHVWGKEARRRSRRRRRRLGRFGDDSSIRTDTSTVSSADDDYHRLIEIHAARASTSTEIEMQPAARATPRRNSD